MKEPKKASRANGDEGNKRHIIKQLRGSLYGPTKRDLKSSDDEPLLKLATYIRRYVNRFNRFPRIAAGSMAERGGYPVIDVSQEYGSIALFSSRDAANAAILACERVYRDKSQAEG